MSRIFLSHSNEDNAKALAVRDWLVAEGWDDIFLDFDPERGLKAGQRWQEALRHASRTCELVFFLISPSWARSQWCLAEFLLAKQLNKRIFGAIVEPVTLDQLPVEMTAEWQLVDLTTGSVGYSTTVQVPGSQEEITVSFPRDGLNRLRMGLLDAGLDASHFTWPPESDPNRPPYRGLKPLDAGDAGIFFGRDGPIVEMLDRLRGLREAAPPRMMVILGASGSGKSSFMQAGILPRLARDSIHYRVLPVIRPNRSVISGEDGLLYCLETALKNAGIPVRRSQIRQAIEMRGPELTRMLRDLALPEDGRPAPTLVLPVDQGEELNLAEGLDEAQQFLRMIGDLLVADAPPILAIFTIRSDSYEPLQTNSELQDIRQVTYSLPPVAPGAYSQMILGPAQRLKGTDRQLVVEDPLVEAMLQDIQAGGGKDALPLLAFTLERLYLEYGGNGVLSLADFDAHERLRGTINAAVEKALQAADANLAAPRDRAAKLALLRRGLIPWLAGIDPESGAPRRRVALWSEIPVEAQPLVRCLVEQRLLSTDVSAETGETTIEPAHEALLRQWGQLQEWLDGDFEDLSVAEGIRRAARDWRANAGDSEWLVHSGGRLELAERVAGRDDFERLFSSQDRAYLGAARSAENAARARTQRKQRLINLGALSAAIVMAALGAVAGWNWYSAREQRDVAELLAVAAQTARDQTLLSQSKFLADIAERTVTAGDPATAVLLALEALPDRASEVDYRRDRALWPPAAVTLEHGLRSMRELKVLEGHGDDVTAVAIAPAGDLVLTAGADGTARAWDAVTGAGIGTMKGHDAPLTDIAISPDGSRVVTGSRDHTARLWEVGTWKQVAVLAGHRGAIRNAVFMAAGDRILTTSQDGEARLWDAGTGKLIRVFDGHSGPITSLAIAADGSHFVTGSFDATVRAYDLRSSGQAMTIPTGDSATTTVALSPVDHNVLVGTSNGRIGIFDMASGKPSRWLMGHSGAVNDMAVSPDGKHMVSGGQDGTVRLWDLRARFSIAVLKGHEASVTRVAITPDGKRAISASRDGSTRLWDIPNASMISVLRGHAGVVANLALSSDGRRLVTASSDDSARIWDVTHDMGTVVLDKASASVFGLSVSPDGNEAVGLGVDNTIERWNLATGAIDRAFRFSDMWPRTIRLSADGGYVIAGFSDGVAVWDARSGELVGSLAAVASPVIDVDSTPDASRIVSLGDNNDVQVWHRTSGKAVQMLDSMPSKANRVGISPDGRQVLVGQEDGTVHAFSTDSGHRESIMKGHLGAVDGFAFFPGGDRVATASRDNTARIWHSGTGEPDLILRGHTQPLTSILATPEGERVVTASRDGTVRVWDSRTGEPLAILGGHGGAVTRVAVTGDGTHIVSADEKGQVLSRWLLPSGQSLVDAAKQTVPRCLTIAQRQRFYLTGAPPPWCEELGKWPDHLVRSEAQSDEALEREALRQRWSGVWNGNGFTFEAELKLDIDDRNQVEGEILWTVLSSPITRPEYLRKLGTQGIEYVSGLYDPEVNLLAVKGVRKDDPHGILGLDSYLIVLSEDRQRLIGGTDAHGGWEAAITLLR